jgi:hypothetical protein
VTGPDVASAASARWSAYNAWAQLRADRANLLADVASRAAPQVIAADRASLAQSQQQFARRSRMRLDVTV